MPPRSAPAKAPTEAAPPPLSAVDRENPGKVSGADLKALAHRMGMARSTVADMPDVRIREQLRYITQNRIERND